MRKLAWITSLLLVLPFTPFAATKDEERPDREMLRLMELLRDWDMIKNLDFMRQLDTLNRLEETASDQGLPKTPQGKAKDKPK